MSDTLLTRRAVKAEEKLSTRIRRGRNAAITVVLMTALYFLIFWQPAVDDYMQSVPGDAMDLLMVVGIPAMAFIAVGCFLQPMVRSCR